MGFINRFNNCIEWFEYCYMAQIFENHNFNTPSMKTLIGDSRLSREQRNEVDAFYLKHYGKKIPYTWHEYYMSFSDKFDKRYFPTLLYTPEYEFLVNPRRYTFALADKNILSMLASGVEGIRVPDVIVSCANGIFRDHDMHQITWDDCKAVLRNAGRVFVKPTVDSNSGNNCRIFEFRNGVDERSGKTIGDTLRSYGRNFNVQRVIECLDSIKALHPASVNTFRVITYITPSGKINACPALLRMGRNCSHLDNGHSNGLFVGIEPDGSMLGTAYTMSGEKHNFHPDSGVAFHSHCIAEFPYVLNKAIEMHTRIPQLGTINWDFTINADGTPLLVEINTSSGSIWPIQIVHGKSAFGDDTEEILEYLRDTRKLYPAKYR